MLAGLQSLEQRLWADLEIGQRLEDKRQQFVAHIGSAEARTGMAAFLQGLR